MKLLRALYLVDVFSGNKKEPGIPGSNRRYIALGFIVHCF